MPVWSAKTSDGCEPYEQHVAGAIEQWMLLRERCLPTLKRLSGGDEDVESVVERMLRCHDAGKLTHRWQERLNEGGNTPPHAAIGAGVFWLATEWDSDLRKAATFAIAIHHVDRGLIGDNIDAPGTQAVMWRLAFEDGRLRWHDEAFDAADASGVPPAALEGLTVDVLEQMARELRRWARGESYAAMHRRRLLACALHHLLRICDVRAANENRDGFEGSPFVESITKGGMIV
ncbi:MAG: CRISPR-associated endonuclease Cas3'' [Armatimonadota bacterium]